MVPVRRSVQVPILYFSDGWNREYHDRFGTRLFIRSFWLESEDLMVPYIATMDEQNRILVPYNIPKGYFILPEDPFLRYKLKLRRFFIQLPLYINRQYFYAEALQVRGVPYRLSIESGEIIRNLLEEIEKR